MWDGATATLTAANAGQVPPRWVHAADGAMETLTEAGPALGFVDEGEGLWPAYSITLAPGDCLCLMSDGLSAMMESGACAELTDEAIRRVVVEHADRPLNELAEAFDEHIAACLARSPQQDDVTVVFLRREK